MRRALLAALLAVASPVAAQQVPVWQLDGRDCGVGYHINIVSDGTDLIGHCRRDQPTASTGPTVSDDTADGYEIGSRWLDTTADAEFVALDVTAGAAVWRRTGPLKVSTQVLTSGTGATYTTPAGVRVLDVFAVGGGGGGGGAAATAGLTSAAAAGGGGGGWCRAIIDTPAATYTYTVGTAGTGGTAGNNAGNGGGTTTFGSPSVCTASNGSGGQGSPAGAAGVVTGGAGGTASGVGTASGTGQNGDAGIRLSGTVMLSGTGGNSALGGGGLHLSTNNAGNTGLQYGGGGSGGAGQNSTAKAGGDGFAGVIIVVEYY